MSEVIIPIPDGCVLSGIELKEDVIISFYESGCKELPNPDDDKTNKEI